MARDLVPLKKPASGPLHPLIYAGIAALLLLFVVSAFDFADGGYADYILAAVTGFFIVAMTIPFVSWRVWRRHGGATTGGRSEGLRDWTAGECDVWQSRLRGREAAIQTLLPISAVAFGLTAIGIVMLLIEYDAL
ncbi:MAG TPA: hypothetical protein VHA55_12850 [Pseudorhodoplanes sp.]|jgi:hypothetical protein|nr:hypothetical protein [Pseudorhodoplanes sp.]